MRGVKIGTKKTGGATFGMSVFEMKDKSKATTPTEEAQLAAAEKVKSSMSDESLGLTSEGDK
jgi:hypothetical protein